MTFNKIILLLIVVLCCAHSFATKHVINQTGFSFAPNSLNVSIGDTVEWRWSSGIHTTTSTSIPGGATPWNSPLNSTTTSFQYVVAMAGVYNYKCTPHELSGMIGSFTAVVTNREDISLVDVNFSNDVRCFPNPASDVLNITTSGIDINTLEIISITGQTVHNLSDITSNELHINLSGYRNGIYFLSLKTSKGKLTRKVIVCI